jgi:hypothetical protein
VGKDAVIDDEIQVLAELKFPVELQQGRVVEIYDMNVDTAAGFAYLQWPRHHSMPWKTEPIECLVKVADGRSCLIREKICCRLKILDDFYEVCLRVLQTSDEKPSILCGRSLIAQLGLQIAGCHSIRNAAGKCLFSSVEVKDIICSVQPWTQVCVDDCVYSCVENENGPRVECSQWSSHDAPIDCPPNCSFLASPENQQTDEVVMPFSAADTGIIESVLERIVSAEQKPLRFCKGATMELLKLDGASDLHDQTHQFVLSLPEVSFEKRRKSYSDILYNKLSKKNQKQFDQLVDGYVSAGWWQPASETDYKNATDVFMHKPGTDKARLVCDFRAFNRQFLQSSSNVPSIEHILLLLRNHISDFVAAGDCSKAFYRIALRPPVALRAGPRTYLCNRVSFGLTMGPEALQSSLGWLLEIWKTVVPKQTQACFVPLYLDDFLLFGNSNLLASLINLLRSCGFAVSKKKFQLNGGNRLNLSLFNIPIAVEAGVFTSRHCYREVFHMIEEFLSAPTKRLGFKLAGRVGWDPLRVLPIHRVWADVFRSVIGKIPAWDEPISLMTVSGLLPLIEWLKELMVDGREFIQSASCNQQFNLLVDASSFGGGYVLKNGTGGALWSRAYAWNGKEFNYHINRLEGLSLLKALREVAKYFEFLKNVSFGVDPPRILTVQSDNKSAVAWASDRGQLNAAGLEFRMLSRLKEALVVEMEVLQEHIPTTITHCSAELNHEADQLSRSLYYKDIGRLIRGEPGSDQDVVEALTDARAHLVEEIAECSFDFDQLQYTILRYAQLFDPRISDDEAEVCLLKAVQTLFTSEQRQKYILREGVYCHEWHDAKGLLCSKGVIPKQARRTRFLFAKKVHRASGHKGKLYDRAAMMGSASPFFVEGMSNICGEVIRKCLLCAVHKARLIPPSPGYVLPRKFDLPPFSRVAIDITYAGRKRPVFAAMCIDTGIVYFYGIPDSTTQSICLAIKVLTARYLVSLRLLHSDNAQTLKDNLISKLRSTGHPDLIATKTPVDGSVANPVERQHRDLWQLVRTRGFMRSLPQAGTTDELNRALEEAAAVINHRPLAFHRDAGVTDIITPAKLAFGSCHGLDGGVNLRFRQLFYEQYFLIYRRRHNQAYRRMKLHVGAYTLVINKTGDKTQQPFNIGHLTEIGKGFLMVRFTTGEIKKIATNCVAPLDRYFYEDREQHPLEDSSGGHVVNSTRNDEFSGSTSQEV